MTRNIQFFFFITHIAQETNKEDFFHTCFVGIFHACIALLINHKTSPFLTQIFGAFSFLLSYFWVVSRMAKYSKNTSSIHRVIIYDSNFPAKN